MRGAALFRKGQALGCLQDARRATQCFSEVRRIAQQTRSEYLLMQVLREEGHAAESMRTAKEKMQEAIQCARELQDEQSLAVGMAGLALVENRAGNISASLRYYREAESIDRSCGNDRGRVYNLNGVAVACRNLRRHAEARKAWQTALGLAENLGMTPMVVKILCNLQNLCALQLSKIPEARRWRRRCEESMRTLGRESLEPDCPVCLQSLDNGEKVFVDPACYHACHFNCLKQGQMPCPLCRHRS